MSSFNIKFCFNEVHYTSELSHKKGVKAKLLTFKYNVFISKLIQRNKEYLT